jgi:hypothetical protein
MKYMIEYTIRHAGKTHEENRNDTQTLTTAFTKWKPEDGLTIHAFVSKLSNSGGYVLVEANDPKTVSSFVSKFLVWNDCEVVPVMEVADSVQIGEASRAWVANALSA